MKRGLKVLLGLSSNAGTGLIVTTVSPMKRGLKVLIAGKYHYNAQNGILKVVTTVSPMKRGLKAIALIYRNRSSKQGRYNRFPDEKGTERPVKTSMNRHAHRDVTTVSPMKRGLKAPSQREVMDRERRCYNRFPDEKGTESKSPVKCTIDTRSRRYNRFPDEKGTESHRNHET